jgi:tRNA (guanine-N7-)-methyltransferase
VKKTRPDFAAASAVQSGRIRWLRSLSNVHCPATSAAFGRTRPLTRCRGRGQVGDVARRTDRLDGVRLRGMQPEDGPALAESHRAAIHAVPENIASAADRESWAFGIESAAYARIEAEGRETFLVAETGGKAVGFVSFALVGPDGEVSGLYVDPDWQGRGIGRQLYERAEAVLRGHGATRIRISASLSGAPAYAAFGFSEVGRGMHRTRGGWKLPTVRMVKLVAGDWRNFYGRRHGKQLRESQKAALKMLTDLSPGAVTREVNPERHTLDLSPFAGRPIWVEIGFGGGEHVIYQAERNPHVQLIGAEPFVNGVAMLLSKIERVGLTNISVHPGDARDLIEVLPKASVDRAFLLYPDPWPKRRHHRRRFVTAEHLEPLARVMSQGAEFRIATDIPDYVRQARMEVPRHGFREETSDTLTPWTDWVATRYEKKALREGRTPRYLTYRRT